MSGWWWKRFETIAPYCGLLADEEVEVDRSRDASGSLLGKGIISSLRWSERFMFRSRRSL